MRDHHRIIVPYLLWAPQTEIISLWELRILKDDVLSMALKPSVPMHGCILQQFLFIDDYD